MEKTVGILDFQGDVIEHINKFKLLNLSVKRVKHKENLEKISHLIIPGGESTVIGRFLESSGLKQAIISKYNENKLAIWGTCAGAILLGKNSSPYSMELIDVELERNAYGSQVQSFSAEIEIPQIVADGPARVISSGPPFCHFDRGRRSWPSGKISSFTAIFIRAPKIIKVGPNVKILAKYKESPILCIEKNILISTFHPELINSTIIEQYFLNLLS